MKFSDSFYQKAIAIWGNKTNTCDICHFFNVYNKSDGGNCLGVCQNKYSTFYLDTVESNFGCRYHLVGICDHGNEVGSCIECKYSCAGS